MLTCPRTELISCACSSQTTEVVLKLSASAHTQLTSWSPLSCWRMWPRPSDSGTGRTGPLAHLECSWPLVSGVDNSPVQILGFLTASAHLTFLYLLSNFTNLYLLTFQELTIYCSQIIYFSNLYPLYNFTNLNVQTKGLVMQFWWNEWTIVGAVARQLQRCTHKMYLCARIFYYVLFIYSKFCRWVMKVAYILFWTHLFSGNAIRRAVLTHKNSYIVHYEFKNRTMRLRDPNIILFRNESSSS